MSIYPVALELGGRLVVLFGGGDVAARRAAGLLAAGARVRLVATEVGEALRRRIERGEIDHRPRDYREGDLDGAFLALAERLAPELLDRIVAEAERRAVPLNVEDDPARCSFLAPAVVRRGDLVVAISTSGRAPALAVRLRQRLEAELGTAHARFLSLAARFRAPLLAAVPSFAERRRRWYELVDSDALLLLTRGEELSAALRFVEILGVAPQAGSRGGGAASAAEPPSAGSPGEQGWERRWTA